MTETSYFHNGTTQGDATLAPYSAEIFSSILNTIYNSDEGYIIPGYLNSFGTLGTATGGAFIKGVLYLDSTGVMVGSPPLAVVDDNWRIYRAVVRVDLENKTVTKYVKMGIPSPYPEPPALLQSDTVYEIPLYQWYMSPAGAITGGPDERKFINTVWHSTNYTTKNLVANGEFMATYSGGLPYWTILNTASIATETQFDLLPRGSSLRITTPDNTGGISQVVRVGKPGNTVYTFKCVVKVDSGTCYIAAGAESVIIQPSRQPKVVMLRGSLAAATDVTITIRSDTAAGSVFTVAGVSLTSGYIDCPFAPQNETILFGAPRLLTSGDGTDGIKEISVPYGTKAVLVMLRVADTNSSASSNVYTAIQTAIGVNPLLRVEVGRMTNSYYGYGIGWIPIDLLTAVPTLDIYNYEIYAESTVSGTLSWSLYALGITV